MSKPQIQLEPENYYHIYNHANGDENIFRSNDNFLYFLKLYSTYITPIADTFAYCLMPNHFHFAVKIKSEKELEKFYHKKINPDSVPNAVGVTLLNSKQFSHLFNSYAQAFNKQYQRRGGLFISNFKRKKITSIEYFLTLIHYIHNNPVHHGFVKIISEWKYSSYHALASNKKTMLARKEILELFGGVKTFNEIHEGKVNKKFLQTVDFE